MSYSEYNPEIESHFIGSLIQYPECWGEVSLAKDTDFSPVNSSIFAVIRQQLDKVPPEPVSIVILSDKLNQFGITAARLGGIDTYDYLWALHAVVYGVAHKCEI